MRYLALLLLLPSLSFAGWSVNEISDSRGGAGFEVREDGVLKTRHAAQHYSDWDAEFFFADFVNDDGVVAGHYKPMENSGGLWRAYGDAGAFMLDPQGQMTLLGVGAPVWMRGEWACFDSYTPFAASADGGMREMPQGCGTSVADDVIAAVPEPQTWQLLLTSAFLGLGFLLRSASAVSSAAAPPSRFPQQSLDAAPA